MLSPHIPYDHRETYSGLRVEWARVGIMKTNGCGSVCSQFWLLSFWAIRAIWMLRLWTGDCRTLFREDLLNEWVTKSLSQPYSWVWPRRFVKWMDRGGECAHLPGLSVSVAGRGLVGASESLRETPSVERSRESSVSTSGHQKGNWCPKGPGTHLSEGGWLEQRALLAPRGPCVRSSLSGLVEQWWFFFSHWLSSSHSLSYLRSWGAEWPPRYELSVSSTKFLLLEPLGPQNVTVYREEGL